MMNARKQTKSGAGKNRAASSSSSASKGVKGKAKKPKTQSKFLKNLLSKKSEVEEAIVRLRHSQNEYENSLHPEDVIEEFDQAEREISAQRYYSLLKRKNDELERVDSLIQRFQMDEEFGWCEECGERIPQKRLLIVPEATLCVPCQTDLEKLDSRKSFAERTFGPVGKERARAWGDMADLDQKERYMPTSGLGETSLVEMDETESGLSEPEQGGTKACKPPPNGSENSFGT
jgi:DnaK suppressor protein